uniref:Uncharacterized protein n=1 Tax=Helicotheca tamesis TaxID=374047 RepID=A0A7S2N3B0_9STRA|mmetsp:Transcript_8590/g.11864  ORF Transcript_8590/g.11864 Transcript_8590/m.11864 type:complete len:353 (+) Transcript_8590:85-1143(+)
MLDLEDMALPLSDNNANGNENRQYSRRRSSGTTARPDLILQSLLDLNPRNEFDRKRFNGHAVIELVRRNPSAAQAKYSFQLFHKAQTGDLSCYPLHMAIALGASVRVVTALHDAFPQATKEKSTSYIGRNALHVACLFNASYDVVSFLLQEYPDAVSEKDRFGQTPFHYACMSADVPLEIISLMLKKCPCIITEKTESGQTPLCLARTRRGSAYDLVKLLLERDPYAVKERDFRHKTPLDYRSDKEEVVGYRSDKEEVVEAMMCVDRLLNNCGSDWGKDENGVVEEIARQFVRRKWWGGMIIIFKLYPTTALQFLNVEDGIVPNVLALVGCNCDMQTMWEVIRNRQDLLSVR